MLLLCVDPQSTGKKGTDEQERFLPPHLNLDGLCEDGVALHLLRLLQVFHRLSFPIHKAIAPLTLRK